MDDESVVLGSQPGTGLLFEIPLSNLRANNSPQEVIINKEVNGDKTSEIMDHNSLVFRLTAQQTCSVTMKQ